MRSSLWLHPRLDMVLLLLVSACGAACGTSTGEKSGLHDGLGDGTGGLHDPGQGGHGAGYDPGDPDHDEPGYYGGSGGGSLGSGGVGQPPPPAAPRVPPPEPLADCEALDSESDLVLYLSADDSNSMASPARARELLSQGVWAQGLGARPYEFLNYYDVSFPAPPTGQLGLHAVAAPGAEPGSYELQLAVRAFDPLPERRPMTLTFVLDTSGSMGGEPILRERAAVLAIASQLREGDIVNMVTWSDSNNVVLEGHAVAGPNDPQVVGAALSLTPGGGTDLESGLEKGYELATQHYGSTRLNRVILISDGGANVGVTSADLIAAHSNDGDQEGIYLVGVGAGVAQSYADHLMDAVTDRGRGAYVYLDSEDEAYEILGERFDETMEIAAREVSVEVTLPWYFQMQKFYGEEYSEDPDEIEPQHLAPGDVMVFQQVLRACDEGVVSLDDTVAVEVSWKTPLAHLDDSTGLVLTLGELLGGDQAPMRKARAVLAYAEALQGALTPDEALTLVSEALADGSDAGLEEIQSLLAPFAGG